MTPDPRGTPVYCTRPRHHLDDTPHTEHGASARKRCEHVIRWEPRAAEEQVPPVEVVAKEHPTHGACFRREGHPPTFHMSPADGGRSDVTWQTEEGRADLDRGILEVLTREPEEQPGTVDGGPLWMGRGPIAKRMLIDNSENALRAVSRGLGRLVAAGLAVTHGKLKATVYRASAAGRRAKEGGGK